MILDCPSHDCKSGPVEESKKYGAPTLQASNSIIIQVGDSFPTGFQELDGVIGNVKVASNRSPQCSAICDRNTRNRFKTCA